ncbi:uncharacterized protein LOC135490984 [Lineus longissimus]|uniref:uncharacterized protein LOC135490984 n=1 Tax=Lineus longissimus TaxID=88925 RepID=UPI00315D2116
MCPAMEGIKLATNLNLNRRKTRRGKRCGQRHRDRVIENVVGDCATLLIADILRSESKKGCTDCVKRREFRGKRRGLRPNFYPKAPKNSSTFIIDNKDFLWDGEVGCIKNRKQPVTPPPVAVLNLLAPPAPLFVTLTNSPFYGERSSEVFNLQTSPTNSEVSDVSGNDASFYVPTPLKSDIHRNTPEKQPESEKDACPLEDMFDSDYESFGEDDTYSFMLQDFESAFQNAQEEPLWSFGRYELIDGISELGDRVAELEHLTSRKEQSVASDSCATLEIGADTVLGEQRSCEDLSDDIRDLYAELEELRQENAHLRSENKS